MSKSEKFWNKIAERYARRPVSNEGIYRRKLTETQRFLRQDMRALEFGCGTGTTAIHHAPKVQHIDAIDISGKMLEIGRARATEQGVENIQFFEGTLQDFNADAASVDAILGLNILHLLADRQAVIAEVARITKPSGVFITSTACLGNSPWRYMRPLVPLAKLLGLMPDFFVVKADELVGEIEDAGFSIERRWHHGKNDVFMFVIARKQ